MRNSWQISNRITLLFYYILKFTAFVKKQKRNKSSPHNSESNKYRYIANFLLIGCFIWCYRSQHLHRRSGGFTRNIRNCIAKYRYYPQLTEYLHKHVITIRSLTPFHYVTACTKSYHSDTDPVQLIMVQILNHFKDSS